jgi:hypothetical protein
MNAIIHLNRSNLFQAGQQETAKIFAWAYEKRGN